MTMPAFLEKYITLLSGTFTQVELPGGFLFEPNYFTAIAMVFLIFLLVLTLGQLRHRYLGWSLKGIMPGITFGFALALIVEGILIIGGRTILTETLGWQNAPKPIVNVLDTGRNRMNSVLSVTDEIPEGKAKEPVNLKQVISDIEELTPEERAKIFTFVCEP